MSKTKIEWAERVWNPVRGCSRVSEGCRNCYAERLAARFSRPLVQDQTGEYAGGDPFAGFARMTREGPRWTGRVELIPSNLSEPLRWRKPARVFVNSMSDLFHESLPFEAIDRVFSVMALAPQHTFQVLTKRPDRMRHFANGLRCDYEEFVPLVAQFVGDNCDADAVVDAAWARYRDGLPNVWLGVSVEDQETADARIPHLLATPAVKRFVSYEPALGPVDFTRLHYERITVIDALAGTHGWPSPHAPGPRLDWIIVGGESGPGARPCDVAWIRSARDQCRAAGVPIFVNQLGANVVNSSEEVGPWPVAPEEQLRMRSRKGGDPSEWPEDLRVREWPESSR